MPGMLCYSFGICVKKDIVKAESRCRWPKWMKSLETFVERIDYVLTEHTHTQNRIALKFQKDYGKDGVQKKS